MSGIDSNSNANTTESILARSVSGHNNAIIRSVVRGNVCGKPVVPADDCPSSLPAIERLVQATASMKEQANAVLSLMMRAESTKEKEGAEYGQRTRFQDEDAANEDTDDAL